MTFFKCATISKAYGSVIALRDAGFSVEKGEVRAILGGNGSGKSTLAKIIGGAVRSDTGTIELETKQIALKSPSSTKKQGIVITSQELSLFPNLTVEKNIVLTHIPRTGGIFTDSRELRAQAKEVLARINLDHLHDKDVSELSDNQKYMVEFAKAIMQKPKVLVIDEITSALYREEVELVRKIVHELSADGCAVLFISHRMSEIYSFCSSVTVMRNGSVISTHRLDQVSEEELLVEMTGIAQQREILAGDMLKLYRESQETLLSVRGMTLPKFGTKIDLDVKKGEMIGIAGLQGQGQSQLLRGIFGIDGKVDMWLADDDLKIASPRDGIKAGMSFLTGDRARDGVFVGRSILENLEIVNMGILGKERFDEGGLLDKYKVKYNSLRQAIETLSGGNQQKVVIARWTGVKPKLLMADDPTKGIDVSARRDAHEIFRSLVMDGSSILMVSSDEEELVQLARMIPTSRILVMYNGQFVKTLTGDDITVANIVAASIPRRSEEHAIHQTTV